MADNEPNRPGKRQFTKAFVSALHTDGTRRKRGYVAAVVAAVVVSAGAAVAVGAAGAHKSASSSASSQLSSLASHAATASALANGNAFRRAVAPSERPGQVTPQVITPPQETIPGSSVGQPASTGPVRESSTPASIGGGPSSVPPPPQTSPPPTVTVENAAAAPPQAKSSAPPTATAPPATASGPTEITGQVSCDSGAPVEGVWVQGPTVSGWASWDQVGDGNADWWYSFPANEKIDYDLAVGCGGSPSHWAVSAHADGITRAQHASFNCEDETKSSDYGKCLPR